MTMDNGEGRPLDELESGQQDPQGWYFDLPSDAWKRQEEKNRLLRERVRNSQSESAEQPKRDPWVLNRPAPEQPKKRGLFGLGRKKRDDDAEREKRGRQPGAHRDDDGDADEWSTEGWPFETPDEPLRLKPRVRADEEESGHAGGFGPEAPPVPPAAVEPPPLRLRSRTEPGDERRLNWDFGPAGWPEPGAQGDGAEGFEPDNPEDEASIFSRMQAWAEQGRAGHHLRLGAAHEAGGEGFDAGQPGGGATEAWAADSDRDVPTGSEADDAAHEDGGAGFLERLRAWAEGGPEAGQRAGGHVLEEGDTGAREARGEMDAEAGEGGEPGPAALAEEDAAASDGDPRGGLETAGREPLPGPMLLRRRQEQESESEPRRSSKWDEFFGLNREPDDEGPGFSEGLAAMREWAKRKPLGDDIRDLSQVPEEFLKPFDWELEEQQERSETEPTDGTTAASETLGTDAVREEAVATEWFAADDEPEPTDGTTAAFDTHATEAVREEAVATEWFAADDEPEPTDGVTAAFETHGTDAVREEAVATEWFAADDEPEPAAAGDDDLAGLFARAAEESDGQPAAEHPVKEKRGFFGRLFGRKRDEELPPAAEPEPTAPAWLFELEQPEDEAESGREAPGVFEGQRIVAGPLTPGPAEGWGRAGATLERDAEAIEEFVAAEPEPSDRQDGAVAAGADQGRAGTAWAEPSGEPDDEWSPEPVVIDEPASVLAPGATGAAGADASAVEDDAWAPEPVALTPSEFGQAVQAALWSEATSEAEETVEEAVASIVEPTLPVETEAEDAPRPWWETSEAEETVEEAVASAAEPTVPVETEAEDAPRPWWETSEAEETVEEAVASIVEPTVPVETDAEDAPRPWWATSEAEETVDEAVASIVEPTLPVETEAEDAPRPWWETSEAEETVEDAVASIVEPVVPVETDADDAPRPWWETSEAEETVEEAVASIVEPTLPVETDAEEAPRPWWETSEAEETVEEAVASIAEPVVPVETDAEEAPRPWWEEVDEPGAGAGLPREGAPAASGAAAEDMAASAREEDMWGAIAETAELAAGFESSDDLDLAASLEAQMGASLDEPPWAQPSPQEEADAPEWLSTEDDEDVILKAFEAHAATPEPEEDPAEAAAREAETAAAIEALFGEPGERVLADAGEEPPERPFIRMAAWAPQRGTSADDGWAPAEEVAAELERRNSPLGYEIDPLTVTPPWLAEAERGETEGAERAAGDGRLKAWIREVVETVMLAALVFLSVRASFGNFKVDGNSMYPTLENGQFLIVNKLVYSEVDLEKLSTFLPFIDPGDDPTRYVFHGPERGDIIVLRDPRDPSTDLIKRVIGLPGETIEIVNGKVYINDRLLEEPYITTPWNDTLPKVLIPPDEYFVMGDNRNNSLDSRSSQVGLVSKDLIIGKATLSYLPLSRFGLAPNEKGVLTDQKPVLTTKRLGEE